jgi:DnaJ-domain-containing protein 1
VGPAEPSSRSLSLLTLLELEELVLTLQRIAPMSRKDQGTKRKLLSMLVAARATRRWKEEMWRRRMEERRIPPEFEERHRRSSINTYEYSLKKHFVVLEVMETASREEVLKAWRRLARRYHPDAEGGDEEMMKTVNLAKERIFRLRRWD